MSFILSILVYSLSVFIVAQVLPSVKVAGFGTAIVVSLVYGVLKFFFNWLLVILSFPLIVLSLGLFLFVLNAFFLWLTGKLVSGFSVGSFLNAVVAAFFITVLDMVFRALLPGV